MIVGMVIMRWDLSETTTKNITTIMISRKVILLLIIHYVAKI